MSNKLVTYRKFGNPENAIPLIDALKLNDIPFEIEQHAQSLDSLFIGGGHEDKLSVKITPADFEKINLFLEKEAEKTLKQMESEHYLFSFADEELVDILEKPDEWSPLDFQIARLLLKYRGRELSSNEIEKMQDDRIAELRKPSTGKVSWMLSYILGSVTGGVLAIMLAWNMIKEKKVLPNGEVVYVYDLKTRNKAQVMMLIGLVQVVAIVTLLIWAL